MRRANSELESSVVVATLVFDESWTFTIIHISPCYVLLNFCHAQVNRVSAMCLSKLSTTDLSLSEG